MKFQVSGLQAEEIRLTESEAEIKAPQGSNLERLLMALFSPIALANQRIRNSLHGGLKPRQEGWLVTRMENVVEQLQVYRSSKVAGHQKTACGTRKKGIPKTGKSELRPHFLLLRYKKLDREEAQPKAGHWPTQCGNLSCYL